MGGVVRAALQACCEEFDLEALAVCDSHGTLIATNSDQPAHAHRTVSAYAPLLLGNSEASQMLHIAQAMIKSTPQLWGRRIRVRPFAVDNDLLYLCSVSHRNAQPRLALDLAARAVKRFMSPS